MKKLPYFLFFCLIFGLTATMASTLDRVKQRGYLKCGTGGRLMGMSYVDDNGKFSGMEVEDCRAVAAAIFGDKNKVKFYPLSLKTRFLAVQTGKVDVLFRSATKTLSRDAALGLNFPAITWYDGQGFLVNKRLGVTSAKQLDGAAICIPPGTTTEKNVAEYFRSQNIHYNPVIIEQVTEIERALEKGRCDVFTQDKTYLIGARSALPDPKHWIILPETISKEPLGPAVRQGDDQWADIISWTVNTLIAAEEFGITSQNVNKWKNSNNEEVLRILGYQGKLGSYLGLSNNFGYNIIAQVGNYKQIYQETLKKYGMPRGLNKLWTQGGLLYAPPFR